MLPDIRLIAKDVENINREKHKLNYLDPYILYLF